MMLLIRYSSLHSTDNDVNENDEDDADDEDDEDEDDDDEDIENDGDFDTTHSTSELPQHWEAQQPSSQKTATVASPSVNVHVSPASVTPTTVTLSDR